MAQEIIYTSAPRGLKKGSRGFCTVVSTAGMGANVAERLESMSGYRHAFAFNDPNVRLNPINYSHVTTRLAGQDLHVISRVADAGQDYSGRTNKLAHHIVVDQTAALPSGPARVLADQSNVITEWDQTVTTRPARILNNPAVPKTVELSAWKTVAGDGGWAGYVAEQLLTNRAPVNVIFKAGTDSIALVQEVVDLVPIPQRWKITFSTYFTRLLAGTECQLRFFLDGTAEATSLRNDARAVTVDLVASLPAATGGQLVDQARSGVLQLQVVNPPKVKPTRSAPTRKQREVPDNEFESLLAPALEDAVPEESTYRLQEQPRSSPPPAAPRPGAGMDAIVETRRRRRRSRSWIVPTVVAFLLFVGAGGGVGIYLLVSDAKNQPAVAEPAADGNTVVADTTADGDTVVVDTTADGDKGSSSDTSEDPQEKEVVTNAAMSETTEVAPKAPSASEPNPQRQPFSDHQPFDDVREMSKTAQEDVFAWLLPASSKPDSSSSVPIPIYVESVANVEISLAEGDRLIQLVKDAETPTWTVKYGENITLGSIVLSKIDSRTEPVKMQWTWDPAVVDKNGDYADDKSKAVRAFRLSRIEFREVRTGKSDASTDRITVRVDEDGWSPFKYLGLQPDAGAIEMDNRQSVLNVPRYNPAGSDSDLRSDRIYIVVKEIDKLRIHAVSGCGLFDSDYEPVIRSPTKVTKSLSWTCEVGLRTKGATTSVPVGDYFIEQSDPHDDLVEVFFQWRRGVNEPTLQVWWNPIAIVVGKHSQIVFPRKPKSEPPVSLSELKENHFQTEKRECLNLPEEIRKSAIPRFRLSDSSVPIDETDKAPQLFWVSLDTNPLSIQSPRPKNKKDSLGIVSVKPELEFLENEDQYKITVASEAHLNRLELKYDIEKKQRGPFQWLGIHEPRYWKVQNDEAKTLVGANIKTIKSDIKKWQQKSQKWFAVDTHADVCLNIKNIYDRDKVLMSLSGTHQCINRHLRTFKKQMTDPRENAKLEDLLSVRKPEEKDAVYGALEKGPVYDAIKAQFDRVNELKERYDQKSTESYLEKIYDTLKGFADIKLGYDIYRECTAMFPGQEEPATVSLYFITTDGEDTP